MNKKGNRRTTATENKIKKVFLDLIKEKEPGKISVMEICERAEIHRTTFYVHYKDINDLMEQMMGEMYDQMMELFLEEGEILKKDGFLHLFQMIQEHREFFSAYLETSGNLVMGYDFLPETLRMRINRMIAARGWDSPEEFGYHQTFFCEGLTAVIRRWILRGCREEPEQMCAIITRECVHL